MRNRGKPPPPTQSPAKQTAVVRIYSSNLTRIHSAFCRSSGSSARSGSGNQPHCGHYTRYIRKPPPTHGPGSPPNPIRDIPPLLHTRRWKAEDSPNPQRPARMYLAIYPSTKKNGKKSPVRTDLEILSKNTQPLYYSTPFLSPLLTCIFPPHPSRCFEQSSLGIICRSSGCSKRQSLMLLSLPRYISP